jgi:putative restriction endonuclease
MSVNQVERAYRAWPALADRASEKTTITYGDLAQILGIHHRTVRFVLGVIQKYCLDEHLPPLTILVVNQKGVLGDGFIAWDVDDLETGLEKVYGWNWKGMENPFSYASDGSTQDDLVKQLVLYPQQADEIFARVKVRGTAQVIFRKALIRVYEGRCAFCGLTFEDALEASHIISWAKASAQQRLDPTNGILLCSIHHKLFDAGLMTVNKSGKIEYYDQDGNDGTYSKTDKDMSLMLHGNSAFFPKLAIHHPSLVSIEEHRKFHKWGA